MSNYSPGLVVIEGMDGVGKSTVVDAMAKALRARGVAVFTTREPGGCSVSESIRELLFKGEDLCRETEILLCQAARYEHIDKVILPAIDAGHLVLCDRFIDSTYVFNAGDDYRLWSMVASTTPRGADGSPLITPILTFYLDADNATIVNRLCGKGDFNRLDTLDYTTIDQRRAMYRTLYQRGDTKSVWFDVGTESPEEIAEGLIDTLESIGVVDAKTTDVAR